MKILKDTFAKYDGAVRAISCFTSFDDLVTAAGNYRPSLNTVSRSKKAVDIKSAAVCLEIATAYDLYMELMGEDGRDYRF